MEIRIKIRTTDITNKIKVVYLLVKTKMDWCQGKGETMDYWMRQKHLQERFETAAVVLTYRPMSEAEYENAACIWKRKPQMYLLMCSF